jgi:Patatin-like phospholipase
MRHGVLDYRLSTSDLTDITVEGDTSSIKPSHPVIQLVLNRFNRKSRPGHREVGDTAKLALCIEGGGMRGCVSAGASAALSILGLNDAVDSVYGSSAGSMVAAYFVARQANGVQIYHGTFNYPSATHIHIHTYAHAPAFLVRRSVPRVTAKHHVPINRYFAGGWKSVYR